MYKLNSKNKADGLDLLRSLKDKTIKTAFLTHNIEEY